MSESVIRSSALLSSARHHRLVPALLAALLASGCASTTDARQDQSATAAPVAETAAVTPDAEPASQSSATRSKGGPVGSSSLRSSPLESASLGASLLAILEETNDPVTPPEKAGNGAAHLAFIARLIEESSAAQQVSDSSNPAAHLRRNEARAYYRSAVAASEAGDAERADELGKKATKMMFMAVRLAEADEVIEVKHERDYRRRLESVNALLDAHERVGAEDELGTSFSQTREVIRQQVARAETLHQQDHLDQARERLDAAYVALKLSIQAAREGQTRIRSLDFATKEEEYQHELTRNDTHQKLVGLFMQDSDTSEGMKRMIDNFLGKARELRQQAENQADDGNHEAAVDSLNESTGQLVRALRTVGIFIPG